MNDILKNIPLEYSRDVNLSQIRKLSNEAFSIPDSKKIPIISKPYDHFLLEYYSTRLSQGCWKTLEEYVNEGNEYEHNTISPFIYNFDYFITHCGTNWYNPAELDQGDRSPCVWKINPDTVSATVSDLYHNDGYLRIGMHSDKPMWEYFVHRILPLCEDYYLTTGTRFIIFTGVGDRANNPNGEHDPGKAIIESPAVARWIVEQNRWTSAFEHPKILQTPIGFCARELILDSVSALEESMDYAMNSMRSKRNLRDKQKLHSNDTVSTTLPPHVTYHRTLLEASDSKEHNKKWADRKSMVLIPYFGDVDKPDGFHGEQRYEYTKYGLSGDCSVCNTQTKYQSHLEMWESFGEYKYVLSPTGLGSDCFRTYEIMLMGAIPVMPFWTGATAYSYANMSVITIRSTNDINERNIRLWDQIFHHGTEKFKLTRKYMNKYAFDPASLLAPSWTRVETN